MKNEIFSKFYSPLCKAEEYKKGLFIEVAGQIRKLSSIPKVDGSYEEAYITWARDSLYRNYGKDFTRDTIFEEMPVFDGETLVPSHLDYQPVIGRYLNTYHPLKYQPMTGGNWVHIEELFRHIFGAQYELGLDYMQLLYLKPMQHLPLLLLVSIKNQTGKSTFCDFLKKVFGQNATGISSEGLRSRFTSTWINKLVVSIEEKLFGKEDEEMIKRIVTAFVGQSEAKGKDSVEVPLFAKLVMTSNNIYNPISIHEDDTRVWAVDVPVLPPRIPGAPDFLTECEKEIPYFLNFLQHREMTTQCEDRLWFRHDRIETDAWRRIVNYCRSNVEKQTAELLLEVMDYCDVDLLHYSIKDLLRLLAYENIKADRLTMKQLLLERWQLRHPNNVCRYNLYMQEGGGYRRTSVTGRCFEFSKEFLQKLTI